MTKQELNQAIQKELIANPSIDSKKLELKYRTNKNVVRANRITVSSKGLIPSVKGKVNAELVAKRLNKSIQKINAISEVMGGFVNKEGVGKGDARGIMKDSVGKGNTKKFNILTLSAAECKVEQLILNEVSKKYKFTSCESNEAVYNQMLITIATKNLPISTHRGTFLDKIEQAQANEYSDLLMDYCGQFGTKHEDIKLAMDKDIVEVGGSICITLNKRISEGTFAMYELMEKLNPPTEKNEMTRCEHSLITFINRVGGMKYAIEQVYHYHDTASMILVIVRRIA